MMERFASAVDGALVCVYIMCSNLRVDCLTHLTLIKDSLTHISHLQPGPVQTPKPLFFRVSVF